MGGQSDASRPLPPPQGERQAVGDASNHDGQFPPGPGMGPGNGGLGKPPMNEVGQVGLLRLFTQPLAKEASWLLPLALLGLPLAAVVLGWKWPLSEKHLALMLWGGWLLTMLAFFSFTYYLIMLGPAIAALVGTTAWALWQMLQKRRWLGWTLLALLALLTEVTGVYQVVTIWQYPTYALPVGVIVVAAWVAGIGLLAWQRPKAQLGNVAVVLGCASLLVAPLTLSGLTTFNTHSNAALPNAGPDTGEGDGPMMSSTLPASGQGIINYLLANTDAGGYLVATLDSHGAALYILATKRPRLTFGGFTEEDNVIAVTQLVEMVASGELRYVLGGEQLTQRKPDISNWVTQNCTIVKLDGVTATSSSQAGGPQQNATLYDCGGQ